MKRTAVLVVCIGLASSLVASSNIQRCKACHGQNFEKKAMGISKIVKDMSKKDITKALNGYRDGTYGGNMKVIMQGQVRNVSKEDVAEIANEITKKDVLDKNSTVESNESIKNIKENFKSSDINSTKIEDVKNNIRVKLKKLNIPKKMYADTGIEGYKGCESCSGKQ